MDTPVEVKKEVIDITNNSKMILVATVVDKKDLNHKIYSMVYGGWRSEWKEANCDWHRRDIPHNHARMNTYSISFKRTPGDNFTIKQIAPDMYTAIDIAKKKYPNDRFYLAMCVNWRNITPVMKNTQLIDYKCAVAVTNSNGEPDLWFVKVRCTEEQFEVGDHYEAAAAHADENGCDSSSIIYDKDCPANEILNLFKWETASIVDLNGEEIVWRRRYFT